MKITPKKYAQSLLEAIEGKSKEEAKDIIARLVAVLAENGHLDKAKAVIAHFEKLWNEKESLSVIEVTTAKEMDDDLRKELKAYASQKFSVKKVELKESVDGKILGGFIIKEGDKVYDASVKGRMFELKERIVK